MKITIRRGVFETNSSSMHSIVILKDDVNAEKQDDNIWLVNKKLQIYGGDLEFGRSPFEILSTAERKLHYAIASILQSAVWGHVTEDGNCDEYLSYKLDEFDSVASGVFKDCIGIDFPMTTKHDETSEWEEPDLGYVDHESSGLLAHFLDKEGITLYEFVSNPKYIVVIDGDEYCVFNTMKHSGLINTNNIVKEYCLDHYFYDFVYEEDKK